jgi:hypothetical protein
MKLQTTILLVLIMLFGGGLVNAQTDKDAKNLYFGERPRKERRQTTTTTVTTTRETRTRTSTTASSRRRNARANTRRTGSGRRPRGNTSSGVAPTPTGLPGTKITIELMRNGKLSFVKPTFRFRSGDKIRIRLKTNFEGYVSVLNLGSSGNVNLLYPVQGRSNYVTPTDDYQIPQGNGWIVFDDRPGTEIVSVIMSESELESFADLDAKSDYFTKDRTSKDLFVQTSGNETYAVFREQETGRNVGFTLKLRHVK